ncbi:MAG: hypothetical protein HY822_08455 [Acidobacteria bacterium]|nr:hypothetical protein [Acidobacteriota bacterium]
MGFLSLVALALVLPWERQGNRFTLKLEDGRAEMDWVGASAFRFARDWSGRPFVNRPGGSDPVEVAAVATGETAEFRTRHLTVEVRNRDLRLRVKDSQGVVLLEELAGARREGAGIVLESSLAAGERVYGLGALALGPLDRRGAKIETPRPLFWSSAGYGRYFPSTDRHSVDLIADRCRVAVAGAARTEHYFYYGPSPKEILEQHVVIAPQVVSWATGDTQVLRSDRLPEYAVRLPGGEALAETVVRLNHAALSGVQMPVFDLGAFTEAPEPLRRRAEQLAMVAPLVTAPAGAEALSRWRNRLRPYLYAYFQEAHDRGIPVLRPLAMQVPREPAAAPHADLYHFGDELLAAPVLSAGGRRDVYLPMGIWTDLRDNRTYTGRRVIPIEAAPEELPLFAKNGAVIPFLEGDRIEAHYFPKLGGEFFIFEPDIGEHTQLHASPAGDYYRFEIESRVDREYEWVAHHLPPPKAVMRGETSLPQVDSRDKLRPGTWFYDAAARNLHLRVTAPADADIILNASF